jgi:hypothetical protein
MWLQIGEKDERRRGRATEQESDIWRAILHSRCFADEREPEIGKQGEKGGWGAEENR